MFKSLDFSYSLIAIFALLCIILAINSKDIDSSCSCHLSNAKSSIPINNTKSQSTSVLPPFKIIKEPSIQAFKPIEPKSEKFSYLNEDFIGSYFPLAI